MLEDLCGWNAVIFFPEYLPLNWKESFKLLLHFLYRIKLLSKHCTETIKLFYCLKNVLWVIKQVVNSCVYMCVCFTWISWSLFMKVLHPFTLACMCLADAFMKSDFCCVWSTRVWTGNLTSGAANTGLLPAGHMWSYLSFSCNRSSWRFQQCYQPQVCAAFRWNVNNICSKMCTRV